MIVDDAKEEKKPEEHTLDKVEVDLVLEDWAISVVDSESGDAFGLRGESLRIGGSPPRAVRDDAGVTTAVSSVLLGMGSLLVEFVPKNGSPSSQLVKSNASSGSSFEFEAETKRIAGAQGPAKVAFKFWLNQLCITLDQALIGKLYNMLNIARDHEELKLDLAALPEKAKLAKEKLKSKMDYSLDELYQAADASVEIQDLQVIVPPDATLEDEALRSISIHGVARKISLRNTPGWASVPHLNDGKALLHAQAAPHEAGPPPVVRRLDGGAKWQVGIEGFDLSLHKDGKLYTHVAEPSDVLLYGRAVKATPPHIEVAIRTTKQKLVASPEIVAFFSASWHSYSSWARKLFDLGESKEESKASLQDKLAQVKDGMSGMDDSVVKRVVESAANQDFAGVINESLSAFTALLYIRFEGGSAQYKNSFAEFEYLQLAAELGGAGQNFVVQLGSVTATNISHDNMAVVLDLHPVHRVKAGSIVSQASSSSSVTIALRRPGKQLGVPTIVELGLNNVAVTSRGTKVKKRGRKKRILFNIKPQGSFPCSNGRRAGQVCRVNFCRWYFGLHKGDDG